MKDIILKSISQLVTPRGNTAKHGKDMNRNLKIRNAAIVIRNGQIVAVGENDCVLREYSTADCEIHDLSGKTVVPGFVDSHTHFIFGGYRPEEFMMRLAGASYLDIHKQGGGIQSTVMATRACSEQQLYRDGMCRLKDMLSMGVTTVEGKSGYGLDEACEIRQLEVMSRLAGKQPVSIVKTYLGAHSIPGEYSGKPEEYVNFMTETMLPKIKERKLAEFVDIFCEEGVFDTTQANRLLTAAKELGFGVKLHADEIVSTGGAELGVRLGAVSADHLLMISEEGIRDMAASDTVATLLPCTAFCLKKAFAPARKMIDAGCAVALASDYNPGSCFTNSVPLLFALAVIYMGMTLDEALCAFTLNGAAALGRSNMIGTIEVGKQADITVLDFPEYEYLVYHTGKNVISEVYKNGISVFRKDEVKVYGC